MPAPVYNWTLERPAWFRPLALLFDSAIAFSLAMVSWYCLGLYLLFRAVRVRKRLALKNQAKPRALHFDPKSGWFLVFSEGSSQALLFTHTWPSNFWLALQFVPADQPLEARKITCIVWRSSLSPQAWRQLRLLLRRFTTPSLPLRPEVL